ncbi:hypothetical protein [Nocardioides dilutus]
MTDDTRLEDAFRVGLQRHADGVDTNVDLLGPARSAARGRRRRTWVAGSVGLAAAALVTAVVVQDAGGPDGRDDSQVVDREPSDPLPTEWRSEVWHGVQVEVPANWGWGTAPISMSFDPRSRLLCGGPGGMVRADGKRLVNPEEGTPWVGRPVMLSDLCLGEPYPEPKAPYVWLGATLPAGTADVGNGFTQETVEVNGTTLTVATDDPALRRLILDSAGSPDGCEASLGAAPVVDSMLMEGLRNPSSAQVCAYRREEGASTFDLVYATTLDDEAAADYHAQVYDGGFESSPEFCGRGGDERVLITITGEDPYGADEVTQATVVDPECREVQGSPGMVSPLSDAGMAAWSRNGVQAVLRAFIGVLG